MDGFKGELPEGIEQENFAAEVDARLRFTAGTFILVAPLGQRGMTPVGIASLWWAVQNVPTTRHIHVNWFPWATTRNRLETLANVVYRLRAQWELWSIVRQKDVKFFDALCALGLGRRMGTFKNYFAKGEDGAMFQSRDVI